MLSPSSANIVDVEECASRVVSSIQNTISAIREEEAFAAVNPKRPPLDDVDLSGILEAQGLFRQAEEVEALVLTKLGTEIKSSFTREECDSRSKLIHFLLLPLLECLTACYRFIDKIPEAPPPPRTNKKKDSKPPPPRGMLSIQNYTDVAALLEFTVCTSVIPCLETGVLPSIQDRAQYLLPKSLAGRVSRVSLLWGSALATKQHEPRAPELERVTAAIGGLVILDRFRPMLLPRHLADVYAGIFQAEQLRCAPPLLEDAWEPALAALLPLRGKATEYGAVDSLNQARAFQSLLLRGMKAPLWLRKRVSSLLADLATRDIFAIVQVFVKSASCSQEDMTSAGLRLVRALLASSGDGIYYTKLCRQFLQLLDFDINRMDASDAAGALTVFAFLKHLPKQRLKGNFLALLVEGTDIADASTSLHRMVRRVIALVSIIPLSHDAEPLCELLFSTVPAQKGVNALSQFLRLASLDTIENVTIKSDAITALRMICSVMGRTSLCSTRKPVDGTDFLCGALVYAIAPTQWDMIGNKYQLAMREESKSTDSPCSLCIRKREVSEKVILSDVEKRAQVLVGEVIAFLGSEEANSPSAKLKSNLPQRFFQNLLLTIFSFSQDNRSTGDIRLSVMVTLPLLCEQCDPEKLLLGTSSDASGILTTFKLILDCAAASLVKENSSRDVDELKSDAANGFYDARELLLQMMTAESPGGIHEARSTLGKLDETLLSTTSIILSLLTAVLELGSGQRHSEELALLKGMNPSLRDLSCLVTGTRDSNIANLQAEIAEMASHAAALIAAQQAPPANQNLPPFERTQKSVSELIAEAEEEIKSDHPAVRAQGAVTLRHLVRGYLIERGEQLPNKPLVTEVTKDLSSVKYDQLLEEVLRVAILTLADPESYVYLAGIQTIVAIADVHPESILSKIGLGICTGSVRLDACSPCDTVNLSQEERIKLAEALLFMVRRRGDAVSVYVSQIMNLMLYGEARLTEPTADAKLIHQQTHDFYMKSDDDENELTPPLDRLNAKSIRLNTGGPIFEAEVDDVLRSSCIAIVAETTSLAMPSSILPFVQTLVKMVTNSLQLDVSRPVRRASALLAVSLYENALRELEEASNMASLTVALVEANEAAMMSVLEASMHSAESSDRLHDSATSARSEEALSIRRLINETGALAGAALFLEAQKRDDEDLTVSLVKKRLQSRVSF